MNCLRVGTLIDLERHRVVDVVDLKSGFPACDMT